MALGPKDVDNNKSSRESIRALIRKNETLSLEKLIDASLLDQALSKAPRLSNDYREIHLHKIPNDQEVQKEIKKIYIKAGWSAVEFGENSWSGGYWIRLYY